MAISPARVSAFEILIRVERENAYGSELLHSEQYAKLSPADHGLATELVMGVLRWRSLLDQRIGAQSSQRVEKFDSEVLTALRMGAYQLWFLQRVPARAAVHESVELVKFARKRSAASLANAVLRKLAASSGQSDPAAEIAAVDSLATLAELSAHPLWLLERWESGLGLNAVRQICLHDQTIPSTDVRLVSPDAADELKHADIELGDGKLIRSARRLISGNLAKTNAFREGRVSIQDAASQLVALLVGEGKNILDSCAAPGGKTRIVADRNPNASILAVEIHPHRARLLRRLVPENNVRIIAADVRILPVNRRFDRVLADVPCSGTGTLARNPEIKWRLRPPDLLELQEKQAGILQSAMEYVAPGGRLIYSTCSLEREENEAVVEAALLENSEFHVLDCRPELQALQQSGELIWEDSASLTSGPYLRTIPGVHPGDGFFAAILQRN